MLSLTPIIHDFAPLYLTAKDHAGRSQAGMAVEFAAISKDDVGLWMTVASIPNGTRKLRQRMLETDDLWADATWRRSYYRIRSSRMIAFPGRDIDAMVHIISNYVYMQSHTGGNELRDTTAPHIRAWVTEAIPYITERANDLLCDVSIRLADAEAGMTLAVNAVHPAHSIHLTQRHPLTCAEHHTIGSPTVRFFARHRKMVEWIENYPIIFTLSKELAQGAEHASHTSDIG